MIDLDLRTRFGRLRAKLGAPTAPMRLAELAWNALSFDERMLSMATKTDLRDGTRSISCAKGCAACCRQIVPLSPPEAWMIADVVRAMPPERRTAVLKRFEDVLATLSTSPLADRSLRETDDQETVGALAADFFDLQLACPFLEDESCSIHPQRPSACRELLVTTPAENCLQIRAKAARRIPVAMHVSQVLSRVAAKILGRASEAIPLHLALDWALAHEEEGARTFDGKMLLETFFAEAQACQLGLPAPSTGE
jgi:Fe-S-cluster containining protein